MSEQAAEIDAACSCAMTEASQRRCALHGEDDWLVTPPASTQDGAR